MIHIIISDTHSPLCLDKAKRYVKDILVKIPETDAIVVNGDLLGIFSMKQSCIYRGREMTDKEKMDQLKAAAPKFYEKFIVSKQITPEMGLEYAKERYQWCIDQLKELSGMKKTIFNLGNHESSLYFLVLRELPFLTGINPGRVDDSQLMKIFQNFETTLKQMESTHDFHYLRNKYIIIDDTMVIGIPGESHATNSNDPESVAQENKTQQLAVMAKLSIEKVSSVIIYNHTQGNYDSSIGKFDTASPSLKKFMMKLPKHVKTRIFVQSHNHWSHTQFMFHDGFHYIMNNAGLHNGIFNIVDFDNEHVDCYDLDPINKKSTLLNLCKDFSPVKNDDELVSRYYPDVKYITIRKNVNSILNTILK